MDILDKKQIKGRLEVRAKCASRRGNSANCVPEGEIGYVIGTKKTGDKEWLVLWPNIKPAYKGDWKSSAHDKSELEPTGKRG